MDGPSTRSGSGSGVGSSLKGMIVFFFLFCFVFVLFFDLITNHMYENVLFKVLSLAN